MIEQMTWIDWVVVVMVGASVLLSLLRGLVQELASLAVWVVALIGATRLAGLGAEPLSFIESEPLRLTLGFILVFVIILVMGRLIGLALKELVTATGATTIDRLLGSVFGLARGLVIVTVLAVLGAMTSLPTQPAWQAAASRPLLESSIHLAAPWLPEFVSTRLSFPRPGAS